MVCADKVRIILETWHFLFHSIQKERRLFSAVEFSTKIFHSFEENKHYYMEYHKLSK